MEDPKGPGPIDDDRFDPSTVRLEIAWAGDEFCVRQFGTTEAHRRETEEVESMATLGDLRVFGMEHHLAQLVEPKDVICGGARSGPHRD